MEKLTVPALEDLVKNDGKVHISDQSKWQDVAAKLALVVSTASKPFLEKHGKDIEFITGKQGELAILMKQALFKALRVDVPTIDSVVARFLCLYDETYKNSDKAKDDDWDAAVVVMQKLSNMNLALLFSFDLQSVLGNDLYKQLNENVLTRLTTLFTKCVGASEWLGRLVVKIAALFEYCSTLDSRFMLDSRFYVFVL